MNIVIGPPVRGDNFWGHTELINRIEATLQHTSVLLYGPRRFGKTSVLHKLQQSQENSIYCDLEATREISEFVSSVIVGTQSILSKSKKKRFFGLLEPRIGDVAELNFNLRRTSDADLLKMWQEVIEQLDDGFYYFLDELSVFLRNLNLYDSSKGELERCLILLRNIRQRNPKIRFIMSSETDLFDLPAGRCVGDYFNDLATVMLPPWTHEDAVGFVEEVLKNLGIQAETDVPEALINHIKPPVPFYVQLLLERLRHEKQPLTSILVDKSYFGLLKEPGSCAFLDHYYTRLSMSFPSDSRKLAVNIMDYLSLSSNDEVRSGDLVTFLRGDKGLPDLEAEDYWKMVRWLEDHGYITIHKERDIIEAHKFLKDWWKFHHASP